MRFPSSPFPLPFLGNYLSILQYGFKNTHVLFEDLHRRHGAIYTFWNHGIGMKPVVSVNSPVIAQAVLSNRKVRACCIDSDVFVVAVYFFFLFFFLLMHRLVRCSCRGRSLTSVRQARAGRGVTVPRRPLLELSV